MTDLLYNLVNAYKKQAYQNGWWRRDLDYRMFEKVKKKKKKE